MLGNKKDADKYKDLVALASLIGHTPECVVGEAVAAVRIARQQDDHEGICNVCHGEGYHEDDSECIFCIGKDKCPICGEQIHFTDKGDDDNNMFWECTNEECDANRDNVQEGKYYIKRHECHCSDRE